MKIIYDDKNIYMTLYKFGDSDVYYGLNFDCTKNKNAVTDIVIKIYYKNSNGYKNESKISNILKINGKLSEHINYPLKSFNFEDMYIVLYNPCLMSLDDFCDENREFLTEEFNDKVIYQMKESINFIHNCDYIHTDIRLDNFLICGKNELNERVLKYIQSYDISTFYKELKKYKIIKSKNIVDNLDDFFVKLHNNITKKFDFIDDDYDDEEETCDTNSIDDYIDNSSCETFESEYSEYEEEYDMFHMDKICEKNIDIKKENNIKKNIYSEIIKNPKILLHDFELMDKKNSFVTCGNINYRSLDNLLGYGSTKKCDIYALNLSIYKLLHGRLKYKIYDDNEYSLVDNPILLYRNFLNSNNNNNDILKSCINSKRYLYLMDGNYIKFLRK